MLYFDIQGDGKVRAASDDYVKDWTTGRECKSFEDADRLARLASEDLNETFLAVDQGGGCYPRFDVIRAPKVGEAVSYGFNGDYYPDGYIVKVGGTNSSRVYTDTGSVYNRYRKSGAWIKRGGTWCMTKGHRDERNPSF